MASNAELTAVRSRGGLTGFGNLFGRENSRWWRSLQWVLQMVIWLALINGIVAVVLSVDSNNTQAREAARAQVAASAGGGSANLPPARSKGEEVFFIYFIMLGIAAPIGASVLAQDALVGEKQSGTAAWILSKPVGRSSFFLSKLASYGLFFLVVMVILQGVVFYIQFTAKGIGGLNPAGFVAAMGLVLLNLLFYLTLSLMLGAFFRQRGAVVGIPLAFCMSSQFLVGLVPGLVPFTPWPLLLEFSGPTLARLLAQGQPLPTLVPIIATALWCILFTVVGLWRFGREEF
jgi:ABC-2 type transport system permease protein